MALAVATTLLFVLSAPGVARAQDQQQQQQQQDCDSNAYPAPPTAVKALVTGDTTVDVSAL